MMSTPRSTNLERRLYVLYHQDGLLDILIGWMLLFLAAVFLFELNALIGLIGIPAVLYISLKQRITSPRLGYIQFESERHTQQKLSLSLLIGVMALLVFVGLYGLRPSLPEPVRNAVQDNLPLIFGLVLGAALTGIAYFLNNRRFYLYGPLCTALIWGAHFAQLRLGFPLAALALTVEGMGIITLVRFLRRYPVSGNDARE